MTIQELVLDKNLVADLKKFLIDRLVDIGIEKMFKGESTAEFRDARNALDLAFDMLDDMSGAEEKPKVMNNMSR